MSSRRKLSEDSQDECTAPKKSRPSLENKQESPDTSGKDSRERAQGYPESSRARLTIHGLHENILVEILQHLDIVKQLALQRVCSQWNTFLTSPSVLRARGVDQVFYMNHHLCTRYIEFSKLVDRTACPELVHLFLGRQIKTNWPEHGYHFHAFLHSNICEILTKQSPRLKTLILSRGFVDKAVLDHCLPSSVRQVRLDRVTICGFGTFPFYKHNIAIKEGILRTGNSHAETGERLWDLAARHCDSLSPEDLEVTIDRVKRAKETGKLKYELLTDIVERREPAAMKDGRWSDLRELGNLTLMELFTFTSCSIYSAMSDKV